jgi:WD40 repeat protein
MILGTSIVAGLLVFALWQRAEAVRQGRIAASRQAAARSVSARLKDEYDLAYLFGVEALSRAETFEAREALFLAFEAATRLRFYIPTPVDMFAFQPGGRLIVSVSRSENSVRLWGLSDKGTVRPSGEFIPSAIEEIRSLDFISNEQVMLRGETTFEIWDISNVATPFFLSNLVIEHDQKIGAYSFNPVNNILAVGYEDGQVIFWNVETIGSPFITSRIKVPLQTQRFDSLSGLEFSRDGTLLAVVAYAETFIVNMADTEMPVLLGAPLKGRDCSPVFGPGNHFLANVCGEEFDFWDISNPSSPQLIAESVSAIEDPNGGLDEGGRIVAFDPMDGSMIASANCTDLRMAYDGICVKSDVFLWDLGGYDNKPHLRKLSLQGHTGNVRQIEFSPNGNILATLDTDGQLILWDISPDGIFPAYAKVDNTHDASSMVFDSEDTLLVTIEASGAVVIWDVADAGDPKILSTFTPVGEVDHLAISPDSHFLVTVSKSNLSLWEIKDPIVPKYLADFPVAHGADIADVQFVQGKNRLYSGSVDGVIVLWGISAVGEVDLISRLSFSSADRITEIAFSPDGRFAISGHRDGTLRTWGLPDLESFQSIAYPLDDFIGAVDGLYLSPDGRRLASTYVGDKELVMWDTSDPKNIIPLAWPLEIDPPGVYAFGILNAAMSADNTLLAASGCTGQDAAGECSGIKLRLWDLTHNVSPQPIGNHMPLSHSSVFAIRPDGKLLVSDEHNGIVFWQLDSAVWGRVACEIAGRNFTQFEWMQYFPGTPYHITCPQWPGGN